MSFEDKENLTDLQTFGNSVYFNKDVYIFGKLYYEFESNTKEIFNDIEVRGSANFLSDVYFESGISVGILTVRQRLDVGIGGTTLRADALNGNVGIGSTTPRKNLDVIGTAIVSDRVGIGSVEPQQRLDIAGSIKINENIYDSINVPGRNGYFLTRDDRGIRWIPLIAESRPEVPGISTDGIFVLDEGVPLYQ
jgi:hypothetical protein